MIDLKKEAIEISRVDTLGATMECPECHAIGLKAAKVGEDADHQGVYALGCFKCGYVKGHKRMEFVQR